MERMHNGLPDELCYAATLAQAVIEQNITLTDEVVHRWLGEGFVNEEEMTQILDFLMEWR